MERNNHIVVKKLSSFYTKEEQFPNCLYLFGQKSVGKSLCLGSFLNSSSDWVKSVEVQAAECYVNKILFETIINAFSGHKPSNDNNYAPSAVKIDSIEDFLNELSVMDTEMSYIIAVENAEKLRDMECNILPVFMKLQELTGLNISCIFLSHIALEKYGMADMIKIHVPDHTKADLIEIFASKFNEISQKTIKNIEKNQALTDIERETQIELAGKLDEDFYRNYLNIFLNVFYKACRDITELQFLANKCYPPYYAPVLSGEIKFNDVTNLWRNITKLMKVSLNTSYMRIENLSANDMSLKPREFEEHVTTPADAVKNTIRAFAQTLELPYYAKYLLIASFLASHNDSKTDKRLFMKHHGKERKRIKKAKVS
jgi:origin recognition complex subunit 5